MAESQENPAASSTPRHPGTQHPQPSGEVRRLGGKFHQILLVQSHREAEPPVLGLSASSWCRSLNLRLISPFGDVRVHLLTESVEGNTKEI